MVESLVEATVEHLNQSKGLPCGTLIAGVCVVSAKIWLVIIVLV